MVASRSDHRRRFGRRSRAHGRLRPHRSARAERRAARDFEPSVRPRTRSRARARIARLSRDRSRIRYVRPSELERVRRTGIVFDGTAVEVRNPLSEDQRFLRTSLAAGFVAYCASVDEAVRVFEIGDTFRSRDGEIEESRDAVFGFAVEPIDEPAWHDTNFLRLKGDCETLLERLTGRTCETERAAAPGLASWQDGRADDRRHARRDRRMRSTRGLAAAFDARLQLYAAFVALDRLPSYATKRYRPAVEVSRNRARFGADARRRRSTPARVERTIVNAIGEDCTSAKAFDEYRGPQIPAGKKSLAVRVELRLRRRDDYRCASRRSDRKREPARRWKRNSARRCARESAASIGRISRSADHRRRRGNQRILARVRGRTRRHRRTDRRVRRAVVV